MLVLNQMILGVINNKCMTMKNSTRMSLIIPIIK